MIFVIEKATLHAPQTMHMIFGSMLCTDKITTPNATFNTAAIKLCILLILVAYCHVKKSAKSKTPTERISAPITGRSNGWFWKIKVKMVIPRIRNPTSTIISKALRKKFLLIILTIKSYFAPKWTFEFYLRMISMIISIIFSKS